MGFLLLVLLNAVLFVRPSEIVPGLEAIPIYNILISSCLLVAFPAVWRELTSASLAATPITVCVVGLLPAAILSHVSHSNLTMAKDVGIDFGKVVLYYLLVVGLLDSTARLRRFVVCLVGMLGIVCLLSLLHYHGVITIPSMKVQERIEVNSTTGEVYTVLQLFGTGIFSDPNDLAVILAVGMGLSLYGLDNPGSAGRWLWLTPLGLFGYTLALTKSRGGFLAMLACVLAAFIGRYGWKKAIPLSVVVLPLMLVLFGGRQTDISTSGGTGQQRIQFWSQSFVLFRSMPLFGRGVYMLPEEIGHVAHNSYVHAYAETGFLGGTLFVGLYTLVFRGLIEAWRGRSEIQDPELRRLGPYLLGGATGFAVGMLTLSRNYVNTAYLVPALVASYLRLVDADTGGTIPLLRFDGRLVRRLLWWSVIAIAVWYAYIRVFARYG